MPDLACAAAAARTTPLAPIRPAISISTRVIRLLTTPILGSEVPGDFSRVNPLALLRPRRERPRGRAAEQRDNLASPHHSMTSSARARTDDGISSPRALAVLRLTTNSYLVGACTGRSAGFCPLRTRST